MLRARALGWVACAAVASADEARSEVWLSAYAGASAALDAQVRVRVGADTDLTYRDVGWDGRSFEWPIYYGFRVTWFPVAPVGGAIDFVHDKAYADAARATRVTGTRGGAAVDAVEPLSSTLRSFSMSHGTNVTTASVIARPCSLRRCELPIDAWAGLGGGFQLPHVEAESALGTMGEYQFTGATVQALAGIRGPRRWALAPFGEYRLTRSQYDVDIPGGTLETTIWSHHLEAGLTWVLAR